MQEYWELGMTAVAFDRDKFRELIVYVAEKTADDPGFGDTHFNKTLYWADFDAYRDLGAPITGARYFKLPKGPAAKPLMPIRDELLDSGDVEVIEPPAGKKLPRKTFPLRSADRSLFTARELELVDGVIGRLSGRTAREISHESHEESVGWQLVEMYEDIPYRTALIADDEAGPEAIASGAAALSRLL